MPRSEPECERGEARQDARQDGEAGQRNQHAPAEDAPDHGERGHAEWGERQERRARAAGAESEGQQRLDDRNLAGRLSG